MIWFIFSLPANSAFSEINDPTNSLQKTENPLLIESLAFRTLTIGVCFICGFNHTRSVYDLILLEQNLLQFQKKVFLLQGNIWLV